MRERGRYPTTTLAQPRRPRHPYAVPRTSLQWVSTRRRNCIEQLSPSPKYAPRLTRFPVSNSATNQTTRWEGRSQGLSESLVRLGNVRSDNQISELVGDPRAFGMACHSCFPATPWSAQQSTYPRHVP